MCGIVGFINKEKNKEKNLDNMLKRIIHRGPDGEGKYIDDVVALGHRRLSIIDLSSGDQPIFNEDKNKVIIFNGEIYNYKDLTKELEKCGHKFKTKSDTEVILHGYEEYGEGILNKLRGMFAFVIWDKENKELFGARDYFGIKPLYYYKDNNNFMFSSEIKAFIDHSKFNKELNKDIIPLYLRFNFTPTDETLFKNVYKLEPGCYFKFKNNKLEIKRYFNLTFEEKEGSVQDFADKVSEVIEDSVKHHMISDVEVGSFLSSGVDSSYLVSLAKPDKTYTVGYENKKYDEISYAKDLTDKLGITNVNKIISKEEYFDIIPKIMYHLDEPLADPAAVALYFVSELASRDVKVVLSGEAADELFGGYNFYRFSVDMAWYNKIPFPIRKVIGKFASLFGDRRGFNFLVRRGEKVEDNYIGVNKVFSERDSKKLVNFKGDFKTNKEITKSVYDSQKGQADTIKMQAIDINFWLIKDIFQKADKMTMANSLEGRVPFADIEVFNLARTIPLSAKVSKENTKLALREAARRVIPNNSYKKKKLGFPVPLREWIKESDIYEMIKESFNSEYSKEFFNNKKINKLLDDHKNNKRDNYKKIWTIYCFLIWYKVYFVD